MTAPYTSSQDLTHFINGRAQAATSGRSQAVYNPTTGAVARQVQLASQDDVNAVVASAQAAFPAWADAPPLRRARVM
ncbi:MAG: aldehyde dehydrogenase family protein, partial [Paucibacter sp.]|nr:aldehyde dehydrogenase family protein [Roseateles sp.]